MEDLVTLGFYLLFGAALLGVPYGFYRAWPKNNQPKWNWKPVLLISIPSALVVSILVTLVVVIIRGLQSLQ